MFYRLTTMVACLSLAIVAGYAGGSGSGQHLVWSDEFSGATGSAPSPENWSYQTGGDGWGNHELECYTSSRSNSVVDGFGYLVISARSSPGARCTDGRTNDYVSARLSTQGLQSFRYGTITMRAKMPTGPGIWPAFWALGADHKTVGWPQSGEIDISEVVGSAATVTHGTLHGPKADGKPYSITSQHRLPTNLSLGFHVYSAAWTPSTVDFSVDGVVYAKVDKATVQQSGAWVFDQPFYLLLNVAVGGDWPGPPSANTTWPQQMIVDYVRVYQDR